jgi:hypothetical protein
LVATLGGGCCKRSVEPVLSGEATGSVRAVDDAAGVTASLGTRVQVRGIAQDDKLSAVVEAKGVTVYCLDLERWPADRIGKLAVIEGTVERTEEFAARPARPPDGLESQGTSGAIFVIRRCTAVL